ncbi:ATP-binding cassette domain-containing protein [Streptomyces werraensis]|uniref:ATP-binding cassette domain-containing protein n=1 Tax=Streptomyces werraensis TaxID=68284 RepID=UPI0036C91254
MFLALRDLRFARGRFALMGAVVALIAVLGVLLSGLASGLADAGISGLRALPVTHMAFDEKATGEQFSRSTVEQEDWEAWSEAKGVVRAGLQRPTSGTVHIDGRLDAAARDRADELIEAVGLAHRTGSRPHQLSGGERQRAGLARALMTSPAVLLVDEPTSALDRMRSAEAVRLIAEQTRRHGTATVMVTHDTAIMDAADRVHEMVDGRLS